LLSRSAFLIILTFASCLSGLCNPCFFAAPSEGKGGVDFLFLFTKIKKKGYPVASLVLAQGQHYNQMQKYV
jgi:hypothetical protein